MKAINQILPTAKMAVVRSGANVSWALASLQTAESHEYGTTSSKNALKSGSFQPVV